MTVTACSQPQNLPQQPPLEELWQSQQAAAGEVLQWNMYARVAISFEDEAYNIGIRWQRQQDGRFMILLEAPFGQGVFRIESSAPGVYRLSLPDGQYFENTSAEALLKDAVGWSIPVSGLDFWIRGLPHPQAAYKHRLDSSGRASSIRQDGWKIRYLEYRPAPDGLQLPRRMRLVDETITLKLAIEHWQPPSSDNSNADLFPSFD